MNAMILAFEKISARHNKKFFFVLLFFKLKIFSID